MTEKDIQIVERPAAYRSRSKYLAMSEAILATVETGKAVRMAGMSRKELNGLRWWFQCKHTSFRLGSRTLPDGVYLWAEPRGNK